MKESYDGEKLRVRCDCGKEHTLVFNPKLQEQLAKKEVFDDIEKKGFIVREGALQGYLHYMKGYMDLRAKHLNTSNTDSENKDGN